MFGIENYLGFVIASVLLNMTPGVDTFYILTRSAAFGRAGGFAAASGILSGCFVHVLCAAFGLSLILAKSALLFLLVKFSGAAYLIYLGIKTFINQPASDMAVSNTEDLHLYKIYKQGILTNILNPKVALFFLSFLPQFINPDAATGPLPFLALGASFLFTGTCWCLFLVWGAAGIGRFLKENPRANRILEKISGLIFIGFGIKLGMEHT